MTSEMNLQFIRICEHIRGFHLQITLPSKNHRHFSWIPFIPIRRYNGKDNTNCRICLTLLKLPHFLVMITAHKQYTCPSNISTMETVVTIIDSKRVVLSFQTKMTLGNSICISIASQDIPKNTFRQLLRNSIQHLISNPSDSGNSMSPPISQR